MLGLLLISGQLLAQTRTITGKVTDDKGTAIAGASVQVKGSTVGTVTREDGTFSLNVPQNARTLVISAVGQAEQEVTIGSQSNLTVSLRSGDSNLQEVIVSTGYTRERKSTFAGAATVLSSKVVETVPVGSFDQALQGRAPGVLVNSGSGQPGTSANVTIRGIASISGANTQPLYVIDGVPMPAFDMQTINPNDFESITVLKDANSSALYGARGGTGVIVITTKKGRAGQTNFQYRSQVGLTTPPDFSQLNLMNSREILQYEERMGLQGAPTNTPGWVYSLNNPANASLPATSPAGSPFAPSRARYTAILDSIGGINMNWRDVLYRQGMSQTHELNMSGGTDRTRFFVSGSYFDQEGIDLGSSLTRYTTRFNLEHTANKLTVALNGTVGYSTTNLSEGEWLGNSARNPFQMTYRAKPYENPYKADGSLNFGANTTLNLKQVANLLEGIENSQWRLNQVKSNAGLTLGYALLPNLNLRNVTGVDFANEYHSRFVNANSYIGSLQQYQSGVAMETNRNVSQLINTSSAIFSKKFAERHDVEVGAYFEILRARQRAFGYTLFNLDPRLTETGQGAGALPTNGAATMPQNATGAKSGFGIRSYFATARYTFNDRYTINANIRRDGTSRIVNPENREITTWSAGAIWNAIREDFMSNQKILTDLRVRASYGIVPNIGSIPTGGYTMSSGITTVTNYQGPQLPTFGNATYAGSTLQGIAPIGPGIPNLEIENIQKANLGLDFAVWNNRARFTFDAYRNITVDLFVSQPLGAPTGFGGQSATINAGRMSNKGFEWTANVDVVRTRDFNVGFGWNHSINKNRIEDLGLVNEYPVGTFIIKEGLPYGTHYTYNYLGADPATGRPRYEKADGTVTTDIGQAGLFHKFGTYLPVHVGGFNTDIRYKGFSVSALFSYQFDVTRYDNINNWITRGTPGYHGSVNASRELFTNQWQKPGDNALYQAVIYDRGFTSSDVADAKFLRFRNLVVAYQIPRIAIGNTQLIKGARFYVQGQNLAIWSPWKGLDPEDNNNISLNEYPNPKMFVAGIDINF
jgi:TonB-linked SusC/RagA family outer membrane protein